MLFADVIDGCLLGDSAYALRRFLLTPFLNPQGPAQLRYNISHKCTRSLVEKTIGILKRRFAVTHFGFRCSVERAQIYLSACVILHNICKLRGDHDIDAAEAVHNDMEPDDVAEQADQQGIQDGRLFRDMIVQRHFGNED